MDFKTYQKLRSYCWQDIGKYIDTPEANSVLELYQKLHGPIGEIQHEQQRAKSLFQCKDLTPRENAAAHLLAVISNHRAMTWQRESEPPGGNEPAPPLTPEQHKAAWKQTRDAANEYAAFIAEREAAAMMATLEKSEPTRDFSEPEPAIHRSQAKDLIGITGLLVRSYAENGMHEQLRNDYGTTVYEAWLSLKCADLATLPAWDAEALRDAATVYLTHSSDMAARSGCTVETHILEDVERLARRIRLAMLAEKSPDVMSPTDGVLLLRRAGIHVFHELLDAVAQTQLAADETLSKYRQLKSIPEPQQTTPATDKETPAPLDTPENASAVQAPTNDEKPWLVIDSRDPAAEQPWYTPARYFARQLVLKDSTLLTKKILLADKVSISLYSVGIFKRGLKKQRLAADTVLKSFVNVILG